MKMKLLEVLGFNGFVSLLCLVKDGKGPKTYMNK